MAANFAVCSQLPMGAGLSGAVGELCSFDFNLLLSIKTNLSMRSHAQAVRPSWARPLHSVLAKGRSLAERHLVHRVHVHVAGAACDEWLVAESLDAAHQLAFALAEIKVGVVIDKVKAEQAGHFFEIGHRCHVHQM